MKESTQERLDAIFRGMFDLPPGADLTKCTQGTTAAWDSMAHVSLVAAIEGEFGISIDAGDSLALTSYEAAHRYLTDLDA